MEIGLQEMVSIKSSLYFFLDALYNIYQLLIVNYPLLLQKW